MKLASSNSLSLGQRLSRWLALQVLISFTLVSLVVYLVIANYLTSRQASSLLEKQDIIEHLMVESRLDPNMDELRHQLDDFLAGHQELQVALRYQNGPVVYEGDDTFAGDPDVKEVSFVVPAFGGDTQPGLVTISVNQHADDELLHWLVFALTVASLLATIAVVYGVYWIVRHELKSVDSLVEQIDQLTASTLESRLDGSSLPTELQPLVLQFNDLLERLSSSYKQLENFNADVAHELNTPLTNLITSSELSLRTMQKGLVEGAVVGSNLEELHRMSEIIRSMLFLSKAERGSQARCEKVGSIAQIASEVIDYHEALLSESELEVQVKGDANGEFDVSLLKRALSNLLGNASEYATPESRIQVTISLLKEDCISVSVCNRGQTIDSQALALIFNRFYRSDIARSLSEKHHGLGLSIVAAIARMHGGHHFARSENGLTCIGFTLARHRGQDAVSAPDEELR
ncbi:heavy metal sensor histidine kinase [Granulosicoccus antarcticus]|uniref:Sensor protein n=1 Tax=Granulosicoccus antarcticus IMCC3135 TaxID=1192854 RepID=A0A2Z2NQT4_9GAMM|nr:heavy metal sensor histidine kinase [Granulosicoccus antarcticus]ASJ73703.1 Sensor protein CzcS [Granulosicoccus antarcticus IMCC3135]